MCNQKINYDKHEKKIRWNQLMFLLFIVGIIGFRIFFNHKYYVNFGDSLARLSGGVIGAYLLSLGVWRWLFKNKKGYQLGCFLSIFLLTSFVDVSKKIPEITQVHRAKQELSRMFLSSSNDTLKDACCSPESQDIAYGIIAPLLTLVKTQIDLDQKDYATVESEMEKTCNLLSDNEDLVNAEKLDKAIEQRERALECLSKAESNVFQRFNNKPQEIQKLKMEEKHKKQALIGYYEQAEATKSHFKKMFNAWRNGLEESRAYYKFLLKKHGSYSIRDNLLIFTKDEDALQNNLHIEAIEKYANEFSQISNEYDQHMKEWIDSI